MRTEPVRLHERRNARDCLALLVLRWISALNERKKIAVYCSDVSGAFDRVDIRRMEATLRAHGIHETLVRLFVSWLQTRHARVVVEGSSSAEMPLSNMVFQGTVFGPVLWNLFYADSREAISAAGFEEEVYADDLNAFKIFDKEVPNESLVKSMKNCQLELHEWGAANQVQFDPSKESIHVVSRHEPLGKSFRLLGVIFDTGLDMDEAIGEVVSSCSWKMRSLLRTGRFHNTQGVVDLYKARLLSFIEYRTPAVYHACSSRLSRVDRIQERFLKEVGLSAEDALLNFNLAPLSSRRARFLRSCTSF